MIRKPAAEVGRQAGLHCEGHSRTLRRNPPREPRAARQPRVHASPIVTVASTFINPAPYHCTLRSGRRKQSSSSFCLIPLSSTATLKTDTMKFFLALSFALLAVSSVAAVELPSNAAVGTTTAPKPTTKQAVVPGAGKKVAVPVTAGKKPAAVPAKKVVVVAKKPVVAPKTTPTPKAAVPAPATNTNSNNDNKNMHWQRTYMGAVSDAQGSVTDACGFNRNNTDSHIFNSMTAGVSSAVWNNGALCGACFAVQCIGSKACRSKSIIRVTVTNHCPGTAKTGGICALPHKAMVLSPAAYDAISKRRNAGDLNLRIMRIPCVEQGGVKFNVVMGNEYFLGVLIQGVNGPGGISSVQCAIGNGAYLPMKRNYGAVWSIVDKKVSGQPISFKITGDTAGVAPIEVKNALPANWAVNGTYASTVNFQ